MRHSIVVPLLFLLYAVPSAVEACTCAPPLAACEAAWQATAVFAGRVEEISPVPGKGPESLRRKVVRFEVIDPFRGTATSDVEVETGAGGGDCGYRFKKGAEYLVYASRNERSGRLTTGICSRTKLLGSAADDLAYLRAAFRDNVPLGRIAGTIELSERNLPRRTDRRRPAEGIAVVIERNGVETRAVTDARGRFAVDGFEAGKYNVRLEVPETHYGQLDSSVLELPDRRGCAETRGIVAFDGRVRGRVTDHDGRSVAGLTVDLTVLSGLEYPEGAERIQAVTGRDGEYEVTRVPPGSYLIGINTEPQRDGSKLPRIFHPGVTGVGDASRVRLAAGERKGIDPLVLPKEARIVPVTGVVLDPDGAPAAGARVFLAGGPERSFILGMPVVADDQGRFTLAAFEGFDYSLFAERREGEWRVSQASDQQRFPAGAGLPPFRLVLRVRY